jgi:murein L,D-transpeptidase YcbB/YkuD
MRRLIGVMAATVALLLVSSRFAIAAPVSERGEIVSILSSGVHPWLSRSDLRDVRDSLSVFYAGRGNAPAWISAGHPTPRALAWVAALEGIEGFGLSLADYDVPALSETCRVLDRGAPRSARTLARFDVALSAVVARTLQSLHGGRIAPAVVDSNLILLHRPLATAQMLDTLSAMGDPRTFLDRVQPPLRQYRLLQRALARYRTAAERITIEPATRPATRLRAGRPLAQAPSLRRVLAWTGDLADSTPPPGAADTVLDTRLVQAIGRFQKRNELPASGALDAKTWSLLDQGVAERVHQIERTLEQWRWLPHNLELPLLLVNIPAFRLAVIDRFDRPESEMFQMKVVVGKAFQTQTPVFTAALTSIDFAPYWDVPPSIATKEVQPQALADTSYLTRNDMELVRNREVVPSTPDMIALIGQGVRVRQKPGVLNALGRVKFVMPNRYDVYLHDTPARYAFDQRQRDMSHGCIRVADPPRLARQLLADRKDWPSARIDSALAGDKTLKVRLAKPMLVAIVYATAVAREGGFVTFYPDVYGHDRALGLLLAGVSPDSVAAERRALQAKRTPPPRPPAPRPPDSLVVDAPAPPTPSEPPAPHPGADGSGH